MTRHVLLPAKLSERLRGGDGKFKQAARTTPEVGQTHKFLALEREASIMVGYTYHVVAMLYILSA